MKNLLKYLIKIKSNKIFILNNEIIHLTKNINKIIYINKQKIENKKKNIIKKKIYISIFKKNINLPIHIIYIYNRKINKNKKKIFYIYINIKKNSNLNIIEEQYCINKKNIKFINIKKKLIINKNTKLNYIQIINLNNKSNFINKEDTIIKKNSKFYKNIFIINSKKINSKNKIYLYKKTKCNIKKISIIKKKKYYYFKTKIIHNYKNSKSYQKYKNIILSKGINKSIEIIKIKKNADKSKATLINNNLCLNNPFLLYNRPQLNILNKKSKCIHKVTTNNIDKKIIFYLLSRGLNNNDIKKIIYIIFIKEKFKNKKYKYIYNKIYKIIYKKK